VDERLVLLVVREDDGRIAFERARRAEPLAELGRAPEPQPEELPDGARAREVRARLLDEQQRGPGVLDLEPHREPPPRLEAVPEQAERARAAHADRLALPVEEVLAELDPRRRPLLRRREDLDAEVAALDPVRDDLDRAAAGEDDRGAPVVRELVRGDRDV